MNIGILLVGAIGGVVVGGGLALQERSRSRRWRDLTTNGVRTQGTITDITSTGRFSAFRRVTVSVDGGGTFIETLGGAEADQWGLVAGGRVALWHRTGDPTDAVLDVPRPARGGLMAPVIAGLLIAALGIAAALVA